MPISKNNIYILIPSWLVGYGNYDWLDVRQMHYGEVLDTLLLDVQKQPSIIMQ